MYVMNTNGSNQTNLTNDPACEGWPGWSPRGGAAVAVAWVASTSPSPICARWQMHRSLLEG